MDFLNLINTHDLNLFVTMAGLFGSLCIIVPLLLEALFGNRCPDIDVIETAKEPEIIECLSAEDVSLEEYLDHTVEVFKVSKSGRWYARRKITCAAQVKQVLPIEAVLDSAVYSDESHLAEIVSMEIAKVRKSLEMDMLGLAGLVLAKVLDVTEKMDEKVGRAQMLAVSYVLLALSVVLPVAEAMDELVEMPSRIIAMEQDLNAIQKDVRKLSVERALGTSRKVRAQLDQRDAPDWPAHLSR